MDNHRINEILELSYKELAPSKICSYIYSLSNIFNTFYHNTKIFTNSELSPLQMSDLTYLNYAANENQIKSMFISGFSKKPFQLTEKPDVTYYPIANVTSGTSHNSVKPY